MELIADDKKVCVIDTQSKRVVKNIIPSQNLAAAFHSQLTPCSLGLFGYLILKLIVQNPSNHRDEQNIFLNTKSVETTSTFGNYDSRKLAQ